MIAENVKALLSELAKSVELVAAAKTRTPEEIIEAVEAGVRIVGHNYVQEAARSIAAVGRRCRWHFIGHLQTNKAKVAVEIFDMIETVDSARLAHELDKRAAAAGRTMPILIEVNSGREPQKHGIFPEDVEALAREIAMLPNLRLEGLMTMGPFEGDPEDARPYFHETRRVFDALTAAEISGISMTHLSMGMTHSYRVAIEEGATMVRIGTGIFGQRD